MKELEQVRNTQINWVRVFFVFFGWNMEIRQRIKRKRSDKRRRFFALFMRSPSFLLKTSTECARYLKPVERRHMFQLETHSVRPSNYAMKHENFCPEARFCRGYKNMFVLLLSQLHWDYSLYSFICLQLSKKSNFENIFQWIKLGLQISRINTKFRVLYWNSNSVLVDWNLIN